MNIINKHQRGEETVSLIKDERDYLVRYEFKGGFAEWRFVKFSEAEEKYIKKSKEI